MGKHVTCYKTENGKTRRVTYEVTGKVKNNDGAQEANTGAGNKNNQPENPANEGAKK